MTLTDQQPAGTKIRYKFGDHQWPTVVRQSVPRKYDDVCLMEPSGEFKGKQTETLSKFTVTEVFWIEWPPGEETVGITLERERLPKPKEDEQS